MNYKEKEDKIINFLQDFGCSSQEQLNILFGNNIDFKYILGTGNVSKKGNIYIHNLKSFDNKMIFALDVLCKYKGRYKQFHTNFSPIYITFLTNENVLYHIIVTDKNDEKGVLKLLKNVEFSMPDADKLIILFEDLEMYSKLECKKQYLYCTYPPVKII